MHSPLLQLIYPALFLWFLLLLSLSSVRELVINFWLALPHMVLVGYFGTTRGMTAMYLPFCVVLRYSIYAIGLFFLSHWIKHGHHIVGRIARAWQLSPQACAHANRAFDVLFVAIPLARACHIIYTGE